MFALLVVPTAASAAGFIPCGGDGQPECQACHFVELGNKLIVWLIGILMVVFAFIMATAGWGLVTSGGNPQAKTAAKDKFTNAIIGLVIVLAAWLLIDTLMKMLLTPGAKSLTTLGPWNQVECTKQPEVKAATVAWGGDPGSLYGNSEVVSTAVCLTANCVDEIAACEDKGLIAERDIPTNKVNCWDIKVGAPAPLTGTPPIACSGGECTDLTGLVPCKAGSGCSISPDMALKLADFHADAAVAGARITEAMPPTRTHRSSCHTEGTCIDYSKVGGMTPAEVNSVIASAVANDLRPVYEVGTPAEKQALVDGGVPAEYIKTLGSHISAPHFSIYGY